MSMNSALARAFASVVLLLIWGGLNLLISAPATLVSGQVAGGQFDNSNASYFSTIGTISAFHGLGMIVTVIGAFLLIMLWWGPLKRLLIGLSAAVLAFGLVTANPAYAYFNTTDKT